MKKVQSQLCHSMIWTRLLVAPILTTQRLGPPLLWFLVLVGLLVLAVAAQAQSAKVVQVGAVNSLFRDVPDLKVKDLTAPLGELMRMHTGLQGEIQSGTDAFTLADQLDKSKIEFGLFHGFEFAWVQQQFPKLKPLMLAVNKQPYVAVHVVTRSGNQITRFEDLKGKQVSLPIRSGGNCYLFVERHTEKTGSDPENFFGKIVQHPTVEDGLDDVVRGKVDAAIVDSRMLEAYKIVKPGTVPFLKTVEKSELFPAAVIVYREGALNQQTLNAFRNGMLNANKDPKSRGMMTLWKLTSFEPVPANYQLALDNIRKTFPAPAAQATKTDDSTKAEGK